MEQPSQDTFETGEGGAAIAALRAELGLTQLEFGALIGVDNKTSVSLIERGRVKPSIRVALAIEELSAGRIDAADLCDDVRIARRGLDNHAPTNTAETEALATGQSGGVSGDQQCGSAA